MANPRSSLRPYGTLAVIGAGAWGTALAVVAAAQVKQVLLWAREADVVTDVEKLRENRRFLAGVAVPANVKAVTNIEKTAAQAEAILLVAPAQHVRATASRLKDAVPSDAPVVLCAKGIENGTGKLLIEVLSEELPGSVLAVLSGPSFARDVAHGLPTAVTIAAPEGEAARLQASLSRPGFRPYGSHDLTGVALGGAAKNVYAIACGMVEGAGFGESARAAVVSRGFAELLRLGGAVGARPETLMGLSGLGDLVLTATSPASRNYSLGLALGKGARVGDVVGAGHPLAEGAATAPALVERARKHGVELPIAEATAAVLAQRIGVAEAAEALLSRPLKAE